MAAISSAPHTENGELPIDNFSELTPSRIGSDPDSWVRVDRTRSHDSYAPMLRFQS